jgi:hypothetical protein
MQSLFVLFHIESQAKYQFTLDLNRQLLQCHTELEDLKERYPELYGDGEESEEEKQENGEISSKEKVGYSGGQFSAGGGSHSDYNS